MGDILYFFILLVQRLALWFRNQPFQGGIIPLILKTIWLDIYNDFALLNKTHIEIGIAIAIDIERAERAFDILAKLFSTNQLNT